MRLHQPQAGFCRLALNFLLGDGHLHTQRLSGHYLILCSANAYMPPFSVQALESGPGWLGVYRFENP